MIKTKSQKVFGDNSYVYRNCRGKSGRDDLSGYTHLNRANFILPGRQYDPLILQLFRIIFFKKNLLCLRSRDFKCV